MQHEVTLRERAALRVLTGQAHRRALAQQRRERERLRVRPVEAASFRDRLRPLFELARELRVRREAVRPGVQLPVEIA
jgi:hypothetical protein